jgi:hypothetical protein
MARHSWEDGQYNILPYLTMGMPCQPDLDILGYFAPDTPVYVVWRHNRLEHITSQQVLAALRAACASIGSACLGSEPHEMGTHLVRSGVAMEMYLTGVPVYTIMLIGKWSSDAFLQYIQKQVKQFLKGI